MWIVTDSGYTPYDYEYVSNNIMKSVILKISNDVI